MQRYSFWGLIILCTCFHACESIAFREAVKRMNRYGKKEFWYEHITDNPNKPKPKTGDELEIEYTLQRRDTILNSSYGTGQAVRVAMPPQEYDNFFTKGLRLMGEGDSLVVIIKSEKIGKEYLGAFYKHFGKDDWVTCTYRAKKIVTTKELAVRRAIELDRLDSLRRANIDLIEAFKRGELNNQLKKTKRGVHYLLQEEGHGDLPKKEDIMNVNYLGYLMNGDLIQDSYLSNQALQVSWGNNSVIAGWLEVLPLLKEGASGLLFIPPKLAYGEQGIEGVIPANATLVFYIKVEYITRR